MRNPLTLALAAMAVHTTIGLCLGWPYPSIATFLAGLLAVVGAVVSPSAPPKATSGLAALTFFDPGLVPPPVLLAALAALVTAVVLPGRRPLGNVAIALPALTVLVLATTM